MGLTLMAFAIAWVVSRTPKEKLNERLILLGTAFLAGILLGLGRKK